MAMQVTLKLMVGNDKGKEFPIACNRFVIGRGDDCQLRPRSEGISREHCVIMINDDNEEVVIRDLDSRNGTFVNSELITKDKALESGDQLRLVRLVFEVVIKGRKAVPKPVVEPDDAFDINEWLDDTDED